jgi:carbonic anhydrase/acetyltransferase-like protein (isoleucine patch superfamily)
MKKYELTSETKATKYDGILYRIRALKAFGDVKVGDYGGWISSERNLAQYGACWVYDEAQVYGRASVDDNARACGNARVYGKAHMYGNAQVYGNAHVYGNARVYGNAHVSGDARVFSKAQVHGDAWMHGGARVCDNARVFGNARVYGNAWVCGNAWVYGEADISQTNDILTIGAIGSRDVCATVHKDARIGVRVSCGSFTGTLDEFAAMVLETHGNNIHARAYNALIELARVVFAHALTGNADKVAAV